MRLFADYWWVLAFPVFIALAIAQWRHMPRPRVVLLLRIAGTMLLLAAIVWFITGNVETEAVSIQLTTSQAWIAGIGGLLALIGAQYLARKGRPSA